MFTLRQLQSLQILRFFTSPVSKLPFTFMTSELLIDFTSLNIISVFSYHTVPYWTTVRT